MSERDRDKRLRRGEHYGLLIREEVPVIMYPIYREDGEIVMIQFRTGAATEGRINQVRNALQKAKPLSDLRHRLRDAG